MNFDRFAYLQSEQGYVADCIKHCKEAEKHVRTHPSQTAASARRALEQLFKNQSAVNELHPENLAQSIRLNCDKITENSEEIRRIANEVRLAGNKAVHYNVRRDENIDAVTRENVDNAMNVVKSLYALVGMFYPVSEEFDEDQVPFNHYRIVRKIPKAACELLADDYNYFVCSNGTPARYYYLQCLSIISELELEARREEAITRMLEDRSRFSYLCIPDLDFDLPENSERKFVAYKAYDDSFLLGEMQAPMTAEQAIDVGLDLINTLSTLKKLGVHHRNIFPGCVLINTDGDRYNAYLLNMQTSKIIDSDTTVIDKLAAAWDKNVYTPEPLREDKKGRITHPWEKVDVYAVCRIVLFCLRPELALTSSTGMLTEYENTHHVTFPDDFKALYKGLFEIDRTYETVPTLERVKEVLENAYRHIS